MKIAIYGRCYKSDFSPETQTILAALQAHNASIWVYAPFHCFVTGELGLALPDCAIFHTADELDSSVDYMLSVGGDGTFLDAAKMVLDKNIPILGINLGRLGFLAQVSNNEISQAINDLFQGNFCVEQRSVLEANGIFIDNNDFPHAINEISVQRSTPVMIKTTVNINGELLSSYWSDGLLISTPTGSTAYSLSVGGPIVLPDSKNFIVTPIAPHNLNIRPIVISDDSFIEIEVATRRGMASVSVDNTMFEIESGAKIYIKKSNYSLNFVKLNNKSFFKTLQDKLHWGFDPRN